MSTLSTLTLVVLLFVGSLLGSESAVKNIRQAQQRNQCSRSDDYGYQTTYPQCANHYGLGTENIEIFFGDFICSSSCGSLLLSYFRTQCQEVVYQYIADYYELQCGVNADGIPCYRFFNSTFTRGFNCESAIEKCKSSIQEDTCSAKCRNELLAISDIFDSCVNSVYNNSYFHFIDHQILPLFSYQLWTACGVPTLPIPNVGGKNQAQTATFTSSAGTFLGIIISLIAAIIASKVM